MPLRRVPRVVGTSGALGISIALNRTIDAQQTTVGGFVQFDLERLPLGERRSVDRQSGPIAQSCYT
jgi:hypothetical protein